MKARSDEQLRYMIGNVAPNTPLATCTKARTMPRRSRLIRAKPQRNKINLTS
jgi:hypothetical protein